MIEDRSNSDFIASDRRNQIRSMFDSIAWRYDFLNHFLSFGIDRHWRNKAVNIIGKHKVKPVILDVATGTGDLSIAAIRIGPERITGIDISTEMLGIGKEKIERLGLTGTIQLIPGDSEHIAFPDSSFDVSMVAFGVRNFSDPAKGLSEMHRVLKSDGLIMVLEFSRPVNFPFSVIYKFYFRKVLPCFGRLFSGNKNAYNYLPESVMRFPDNEDFLELMRSAGFVNTSQIRLTGGVASIYTGFKAQEQY